MFRSLRSRNCPPTFNNRGATLDQNGEVHSENALKTHLRQYKIETLGKEKGKEARREEGEGKWDIMRRWNK